MADLNRGRLGEARSCRLRTIAVIALVAAMAGCAGGSPGTTSGGGSTAAPTAEPVHQGPSVLAAGDVGSCDGDGDEQTAALLDRLPGTVLVLGDTVYDEATARQFDRCYRPSWGRHLDRTRPAPGNHDYEVKGASGYFDYFGSRAGERGKGWYSFDVGEWHLIALNSNCSAVGGCGPGSEQEHWLRADLAANPARCTLAFWHHPRFSSGREHGSSRAVDGLWRALVDAGADVVLSGHEHSYERFAPLDEEGRVDQARGIRQFVVGTGGRSHYRFGSPISGSEVRQSGTFGVLHLTLGSDGYDWRFEPVSVGPATDAGSASCH